MSRLVTNAPKLPTILYDGHCRFCTAQMNSLARFLPAGRYQAQSFQDDGVLDEFPGVTHDRAMREMIFVDARGRVFGGAEAAVRAVGVRPIGRLAFLFYIPGVRQLVSWLYQVIARNRYNLRPLRGGSCSTSSCTNSAESPEHGQNSSR